jgi:ribose/xylose/arabinose/galactoside ABC-type transport system permease subunit
MITTVGTDLNWRSRLGRITSKATRRSEFRAVVLLVFVAVFAIFATPIVFSAYPVTLGRIALVGLVALGLTAVILQGELDLSVASTLALSGIVVAMFPDTRLGIVAALAAGVLIGIINAFLVVVVGINSFIATLGMLFALRGLAFVLSDEGPVRVADLEMSAQFSAPLLGPLTPRVLLFISAFILLHIFLTRFKAGREFYAVGGNRQAAKEAGVPVRRRIFTGFMISGFISALAGVMNTLERTTADPTAGSTVLLASFAAAIIGGAVLNGGRGSVLGTLIGASALGILQVSFILAGIQVDIQDVVIGSILLLAVTTDPATLKAAVRAMSPANRRRSAQNRSKANG